MNETQHPASEPEQNAPEQAEQPVAPPASAEAAATAEASGAPSSYLGAPPAAPAEPDVVRVAVSAPAPTPRRRTWIPVVGALAAGAVFGAAAGAGSALAVLRADGSASGAPLPVSPQTITVNDTTSVNAVTAVAASAIDSVVTISVSDQAV
ncbi:MAG: hypothetical protein J7480_03590, partial [Microbacteriaceae bacterium]|nr:hypothetical protein [Microbacteriaceae bacterium]